MNRSYRPRLSWPASLASVLILSLTIASNAGANTPGTTTNYEQAFKKERKTKLAIITDALDDDLRAVWTIAGNSRARKRLSLVVTNDMHTGLKSAVMRRVLTGLGIRESQVPVVSGLGGVTSTRERFMRTLVGDSYAREGEGIISKVEIDRIRRMEPQSSTDGVDALVSFVHKNPGADLLLMSNPSTLVAAIEKDPTISKKIGRVITMGLWQKRDGKYFTAYNTMMDEQATIKFVDLVKKHRISLINFPSHLIWQIPQLDSGHVSARKHPKLIKRIKGLSKDSNLPAISETVAQSALWRAHYRNAEVGWAGFLGAANSAAAPEDFYCADPLIATLAMHGDAFIKRARPVSAKFSDGSLEEHRAQGRTLQVKDDPNSTIFEVEEVHGDRLVSMMNSDLKMMPNLARHDQRKETQQSGNDIVKKRTKGKIILVTKGSTDDLRGILHFAATDKGRERLGLVVTSDFNTRLVKAMVKKLLGKLRLSSVPVAQGTAEPKEGYLGFGNLGLEANNQSLGNAILGQRKADRLRRSGNRESSDAGHKAIIRMLERNDDVEIVINSSPSDVYKALSLRPDLAKKIARLSVMGGWKNEGDRQITRNWLIDPVVANQFLALVQKQKIPTVIFSSHSGAGILNDATAPEYKQEIARTEAEGLEAALLVRGETLAWNREVSKLIRGKRKQDLNAPWTEAEHNFQESNISSPLALLQATHTLDGRFLAHAKTRRVAVTLELGDAEKMVKHGVKAKVVPDSNSSIVVIDGREPVAEMVEHLSRAQRNLAPKVRKASTLKARLGQVFSRFKRTRPSATAQRTR